MPGMTSIVYALPIWVWIHIENMTVRESRAQNCASNGQMKEAEKSIFDQQYRVVAVEGDRLMVRGVVNGEVLTIVNPEPETPLTPEEYPPGKLIVLTDPSTSPLN
jgi:hypothetical protein